MNLIKNFKFKPYLKNLEVHMVIGTLQADFVSSEHIHVCLHVG